MTHATRPAIAARLFLAGVLLLPLTGLASAQDTARPAKPAAAARVWPLTRPEATNYAETSRYEDVISFMKAMAAASPRIHLTTCGYTFEGRPMPLAVVGAPGATARSRARKPRCGCCGRSPGASGPRGCSTWCCSSTRSTTPTATSG
jgi:hypothetical protein